MTPSEADLVIRTASSRDLDAVAETWHESAASMDWGALDVPSRAALRQRIDEELKSGWDLRVALCGGRIVGFLAMKPRNSVLDQIFVRPSDQGRGVGAALMEIAKRTMPAGFSLRMDATNEGARRFYERQELKLVSEGIHPRSGIPVQYYEWQVGRRPNER